MNEEMNKWFGELMPFLTGEKKWDTGCIWVCESHSLLPFDMGYTFDCKCGAPGMSPYIYQTPEKVIDLFVSQCEKSLNPDLFTDLIEKIVLALRLAVGNKLCATCGGSGEVQEECAGGSKISHPCPVCKK